MNSDSSYSMDEMRQDAWFYSRNGEKIGPVSFADLQAKAKEAGLNPRLDMVWTQGMDAWKAAGEIEGLFERLAAPEPPPSLAPAADSYTPPPQESIESFMNKEGDWPGARRRSFLIATLVFPCLWTFGFTAATGFLSSQLGPEIMNYATLGANFVPLLVAVYFSLRRLVNLGMSCWWLLGYFVPPLTFWVGYRCFACPGGYAYHKKLDGAGIFLAILYWLLLAVIVVATAAAIALLFGVIGTPEIQQQVRDTLRTATEFNP